MTGRMDSRTNTWSKPLYLSNWRVKRGYPPRNATVPCSRTRSWRPCPSICSTLRRVKFRLAIPPQKAGGYSKVDVTLLPGRLRSTGGRHPAFRAATLGFAERSDERFFQDRWDRTGQQNERRSRDRHL